MPRPIPPKPKRKSKLYAKLHPVEWALLCYYADAKKVTRHEMAEKMVRMYTNADPSFDAKAFLTFVRTQLAPHQEDASMRGELLRQTILFTKDREAADEPTATLAQTPLRRSGES